MKKGRKTSLPDDEDSGSEDDVLESDTKRPTKGRRNTFKKENLPSVIKDAWSIVYASLIQWYASIRNPFWVTDELLAEALLAIFNETAHYTKKSRITSGELEFVSVLPVGMIANADAGTVETTAIVVQEFVRPHCADGGRHYVRVRWSPRRPGTARNCYRSS